MHFPSLQSSSTEDPAFRQQVVNPGALPFGYTSETIPANIRESYIQQHLPIRNQSLAAFAHGRRPTAAASLELTLTHKNAVLQPPPPPKFKHVLAEAVTYEPQTTPQYNTLLQPDTTEEYDFNFKDRPPSFMSCDRPISEDYDIKRVDLSTSTQPYALSGTFRLNTTHDENDHVHNMLTHSRSEPAAEWGDYPRASCDTTMSELSDTLSNITPHVSILMHTQPKVSTFSQYNRSYQQPKLSDPSLMYLASLSRVAKELFRRISVSTMTKNNIQYHNAFSGRHAIDCLLQIIHTKDRNLALLVGRALDSQNFIHNVNYEHRLRDSADELYCFKAQLDVLGAESDEYTVQDTELPNGIFTVLTDCYSPTCSREYPCYSVHCPRNAKGPFKPAHRNNSSSSKEETEEEARKLWIHSVPQEIVDLTSTEERERQECIYELIHTEAAFVEDLQYVHNYWVKPLITSPDIIPSDRREDFVQEVFWNINDIEKTSSALSSALNERQKETYVVTTIGDVLLASVCDFAPFVLYGAHQVIGKSKFELEKRRNPKFAAFVYDTERLPRSRRLELNGYLTKPTTRLGRYNLLLREILKRTSPSNPDSEMIPQVIDMITRILVQVNSETGKCDNAFNLQQIDQRLSFKSPAVYADLQLSDPKRQLLLKGRMRRKGNPSSAASEVQVFLFDHYIVFVKVKYFDFLEHYKVYRKPIPLELLSVTTTGQPSRPKRASIILPYSRSMSMSLSSSVVNLPHVALTDENNTAFKSRGWPITFCHHGRRGSPPLTLYCSSAAMKKSWIDQITEQQQELSTNQSVFSIKTLLKQQFQVANRVTSTVVQQKSSATSRMLLGTEHGVFLADVNDNVQNPRRIVSLEKITHIEVVEESQLLLVLADKTLWSFSLDIIDEDVSSLKMGRMISQNTTLFHVGRCMDRMLVCIVKANTLATSTIRVLEPILADEGKKQRSMFSIKRLARNDVGGFKSYKDLYLPSEASGITLLKSMMCITCPREIGVVDMTNFGVQTLLDPQDESLDFVSSRQDIRPVTIYRVRFAEYLVCYNEFAFLVDQRGRLVQSSFRIEWEGTPDSFALSYPYVLAFEPGFIEVHNLLTGQLEQLIRGTDIRCTNANGPIQGTMNDPDCEGFQLIFQLEKIAAGSS